MDLYLCHACNRTHISPHATCIWCGTTPPNTCGVTPDAIKALAPGEVFVFGSNLSGRHGKGAARTAILRFGAVYGVGSGMQGDSYGIPTVDAAVRNPLTLDEIKTHVGAFIAFASRTTKCRFLVTQIGCGLAGYKVEDIAPMFRPCLHMENVTLPLPFLLFFVHTHVLTEIRNA